MIFKFEDIIGQEQPILRLKILLDNKMAARSLLFTGTNGVGKYKTAKTFAMALNCVGESSISLPCGICRSCKKIISDNNPDIISLKSEGTAIKISQIRSLCDIITMKNYEADMRVVIIDDAHLMNIEASNALLKILEEPPDKTVFILIADQFSSLLPTISSRCQHIRFNSISAKNIEILLAKNYGISCDNAKKISTLANGSIAKALSISQEKWMNWRSWIIEEISELQSRPLIVLAFAEKLSKNKDIIEDTLELINSWFRDLLIFKFSQELIINKDFLKIISNKSVNFGVNALVFKIEAILSAQKDLKSNSNIKLTLENLLFRLSS